MKYKPRWTTTNAAFLCQNPQKFYEVLVTTMTVPLYSLLKPDKKNGAGNKNCAAFLISLIVYGLFTMLVMLKIGSITKFICAEK